MPDLLTQSQAKDFLACRRLCYHKYESGLRPWQGSEKQNFGILVHKQLAECLTNGVFNPMDHNLASEEDKATVIKANAMVSSAFNALRQYMDSSGIKISKVEYRFEVPIPSSKGKRKAYSVMYSGRVDGFGTDGDGVILIEHKTASDVDGLYFERLRTDPQINLYAYALEKILGTKVSRCLYNVMLKCGLRKKGLDSLHSESWDDYSDRVTAWHAEPGRNIVEKVPLDDNNKAEAMRELQWTWYQILESRRNNFWPRSTNHCQSRYGQCPYTVLCTGSADCIDSYFERVSDPHPELMEDNANATN